MSAPAGLVVLAATAKTTATTVPAGQDASVPTLTGPTALLALVAFLLIVAKAGKARSLADIPLAIVGALLGLMVAVSRRLVRWGAAKLGFGWMQWCWLGLTALLVGQAYRQGIPFHAAWTAAAFAWGAWLAFRLRAAHRRRTAPKRYAKAMRKTAQAIKAQAKTAPAAGAAASSARPLSVVPPPPAGVVAVKERPAPPPEPQHWTPEAPALDPILPRWMGGGRWRRWRDR